MLELRGLDNFKSPKEKLEVISKVHKMLVDGLMVQHDDVNLPSQSSADLLLPLLIYRYVSLVM